MNHPQKKVLLVGSGLGAGLCILVGLATESPFVGLIAPLALVCFSIYVWVGRSERTSAAFASTGGDVFKEYVELFEKSNIDAFVASFCASVDLNETEPDATAIDVKKLEGFLRARLDRNAFNNSMLLAMKTTFTEMEIRALGTFHSSPEGMSIVSKQHAMVTKCGALLKPEIEKLIEEYLNENET